MGGIPWGDERRETDFVGSCKAKMIRPEDVERARKVWDAARNGILSDRRNLAAGLAAREELKAFRDRLRGAWAELSDDAKDSVDWTVKYSSGCAPADAFFRTLDESVENIVGKRGNPGSRRGSKTPKAGEPDVVIAVIRRIAEEFGLHGYGPGNRALPVEETATHAEKKLYELCHAVDPGVTRENVRQALKGMGPAPGGW